MTTVVETDVLDIEHRLICRILTEPADWIPVINARIDEQFFQNPKHLKVWRAIWAYYSAYHTVPTIAMLRADFPRETYRFFRVQEPIAYLIDEIQDSRRAAVLERGMEEIATAWEAGDYDSAQRAVDATSAEIYRAIPVAEDTDITKTGDERLAAYMERVGREDGEIVGIPTGYKSLDKATGGLQPEQLVTLAGFAKNGKSFVLLDMARAAHLSGHSPLFIGFEMSNREQGERIDASRAGVSMKALREGTLTKNEWERLRRAMSLLSEMHPFVLSTDRGRTMTLSGIAAKIDQLRPPCLFVDGVYMMDDENGEPKMSPRALTNITQGFKRLAQTYKIPIVISTQGLEWKSDRGKGMSRRTVGYSSSFLADSDDLIGVEISQDDPDIQILKVMASRTCPPQDFYIRRDWDRGYYEELEFNPFESDGTEGDDDGYGSY
jgi:replicative DNA helicase